MESVKPDLGTLATIFFFFFFFYVFFLFFLCIYFSYVLVFIFEGYNVTGLRRMLLDFGLIFQHNFTYIYIEFSIMFIMLVDN